MKEDIGFNFFEKNNSFVHIYNIKENPARHKLFLAYLSTILLHDLAAIFLEDWHGICIDFVVSRYSSTSYGKLRRAVCPKSLVTNALR